MAGGIDAYVAGQDYAQWWYPTGRCDWRGVMLCHPAGWGVVGQPIGWPGTAYGGWTLHDAAESTRHRRGYVLVSTDHGGSQSWGHDVAIDGLDDTYTLLAAAADAAKIVVLGQSMGFINALAWAHRNPTLVAAVIGVTPPCDMWTYRGTDANQNTWYTLINTRYGVSTDAGFAAAIADDRNPIDYADSLAGDFPVWMLYPSDDEIVPGSEVLDCADAIGHRAVTVDIGTGGHTAFTVTADRYRACLDAAAWT